MFFKFLEQQEEPEMEVYEIPTSNPEPPSNQQYANFDTNGNFNPLGIFYEDTVYQDYPPELEFEAQPSFFTQGDTPLRDETCFAVACLQELPVKRFQVDSEQQVCLMDDLANKTFEINDVIYEVNGDF